MKELGKDGDLIIKIVMLRGKGISNNGAMDIMMSTLVNVFDM